MELMEIQEQLQQQADKLQGELFRYREKDLNKHNPLLAMFEEAPDTIRAMTCPACGEESSDIVFQVYGNESDPHITTAERGIENCVCGKARQLKAEIYRKCKQTFAVLREKAIRASEVAEAKKRAAESKITPDMKGKTLDNFEINENTPESLKKAHQGCVDYVRLWEQHRESGSGLLLSAPVRGCGKTHLACAVGNAISGIDTVRFLPAPTFRTEFKSRNIDEKMDEYGRCSLLIFDDIGKYELKDWQTEYMYMLINYRYEEKLPMIVTTNKNARQLSRTLDSAVVSRLVGMCDTYKIHGASDYRMRKNGG